MRFLSYFIIATSFFVSTSPAQTTITPGEEQTFPFAPGEERTFVFEASGGNFITVTAVAVDDSVPVSIELIKPGSDDRAINSGINAPFFSGAYLYTTASITGEYELIIRPDTSSEPTDILILVTQEAADPEFQPLAPGTPASGTIGPAGNLDFYEIFLPADFPFIVTAYTPRNILDPLIGIFDPSGDLVAVNNDFIQRQPALIARTSQEGVYFIAVQGSFEISVGPYTVVANSIRPLSAGSSVNGRFLNPGDVLAYEIDVEESQTYDFRLQSSDELETSFVLVAPDMTVITAGVVEDATASRVIPGFTPLFDGPLYLVVVPQDRDETGRVTVSAGINPDEDDPQVLPLNETITAEIGPLGDTDLYQFEAEANTRYSIWVDPTWHLLDPAMTIRDAVGEIVFQAEDAIEDVDAMLSGIEFPQTGTYFIEVSSTPAEINPQFLTGVYNITAATGAPFDGAPPRIVEPFFELTNVASGFDIRFSSAAVFDDTFPVNVNFVVERTGTQAHSQLDRNAINTITMEANPDDIVFVSATDSSDNRNQSLEFVLPAPSVIATVTGQALGLAINADNEWFATDSRAGAVFRIRPDGATETVYQGNAGSGGSVGLNALAFNSEDELFVSDAATNSIYQILDPDTILPYVTGLAFPIDIAFDDSGTLYVSQIGSDVIETVSPDGERSVFATGIRNPNAIAFSPDGQLYVVNSDRGQSTVFAISSDGTPTPFVEPFAEVLEGLAFDTDGYLYTIDGVLGVLYRISPNGEIRIFARGLSGPSDLAFGTGESGKTLYATNLGSVPDIYAQRFIAIQTGRWGLALPYGTETTVANWMLY